MFVTTGNIFVVGGGSCRGRGLRSQRRLEVILDETEILATLVEICKMRFERTF